MSHKSSIHAVLFLLLAIPASGQVPTRVEAPDYGTWSGKPLVTACFSRDHLRLTALALTRQIRLEVLSQTGEPVYDSGFHPGNRLEWEVNDQQGAGLRDGIYGCIVTIEDLNGQVSHRQGIFKVGGGIVSFDTASPETTSAASDDQEDVTILRPEEPSPFTFLSHNGKEGWVESAAGGLNFYAGSLSRTRDNVPQLRLTPEGNLGIGISEPTAKLDVAGLIRASEGFQFSDGTILRMEGGIPVLVTSASRSPLLGSIFSFTGLAEFNKVQDRDFRCSTPGVSQIKAGARMLGLEGGAPLYNTLYGLDAGHSISTGEGNSLFGWNAGYYNTGGFHNSFFGYKAGHSNDTGMDNSFFGWNTGLSNTSGGGNSFFGTSAGWSNTSGNFNSFFGLSAGASNNTGNYNSFFGWNAGVANTLGDYNSFLGFRAGFSNTSGQLNTFGGGNTGFSNITGSLNSFFGQAAGFGNTTGSWNSFFGQSAGGMNTIGNHNSFFGYGAGSSNLTGGNNAFFGEGAGGANNSGSDNSFFGFQSGLSNTTESNNNFMGNYSDGAAGITNATAIGNRAKVTQSNSLVLGSINGVNGATASTKVGIGTTSPSSPLHVVGAFQVVQSSSPNDTVGVFQQFNTSAYSGFGYFGVEGSTPGLTMSGTSAYATFLGAGSSGSVLQLGSAGTIRMTINPSGNVGIGTASPTARLHVVGGVLATDGFSTPSDARLKQDIKPLAYGLDDILRLRPVSFYWRDRNDSKLNLGLIAQEVAPVIPEIVETSKDEAGTMGMNYSALIPVLVKAIQEQQAALNGKDAEISRLVAQNTTMESRLMALEQMVQRLISQGSTKQEK